MNPRILTFFKNTSLHCELAELLHVGTSQTSSYLYGQPEFQKEFISAEEAKRIVATKYVATVCQPAAAGGL